MDTLSSAFENLKFDVGNVLAGLVLITLVFIIARYVSRWGRRRVERVLSERAFGRNGAVLLGRLFSIAVYIFAFVIILASMGVSWTGLLTFLGAGTVALGLSLQDVLKNFFSGVFLLMERPFKVGDFIKVKEVEGEVQGIDVRTTLVQVSDGSIVMIPNSLVFTEVLSNRSKSGLRRIDFKVVALNKTVSEAERLIHSALSVIPEVSRPIPAPVVNAASSKETTFVISLLIENSRDVEQHVIEALVGAAADGSITVTRP
jgi:small-conductance mechanosensitive channel